MHKYTHFKQVERSLDMLTLFHWLCAVSFQRLCFPFYSLVHPFACNTILSSVWHHHMHTENRDTNKTYSQHCHVIHFFRNQKLHSKNTVLHSFKIIFLPKSKIFAYSTEISVNALKMHSTHSFRFAPFGTRPNSCVVYWSHFHFSYFDTEWTPPCQPNWFKNQHHCRGKICCYSMSFCRGCCHEKNHLICIKLNYSFCKIWPKMW